jgi:hypothetical protein
MAPHYRKDGPNGITAPHLDSDKNIVAHITKHRGMKTPYTSVSEEEWAVNHFSGDLYRTESQDIIDDSHKFIAHPDLVDLLKREISTSSRENKDRAQRAYMYAIKAKEALIDWQFHLDGVDRKDRITWCYRHIQKYFRKV